ncbi:hypothetical protein [Streptomyces sp. NPDC088115]|uniref:hypothetical protein n=1 Tax=Streptomyces sp. NPDC088115 TaxID=3365824 RepID=UPI0038046C8E
MTETHPHNGQNPTPASTIAVLAITLYAAVVLTPDQLEHLLAVLGLPATVLGLAAASRQT